MLQESTLQIEDGWFFVRHSELHRSRSVPLFVHGLGESGLWFKEAFESRHMNEYNIVVPDMMGYGRSSSTASGDYSMESQIRRLWRLVELLDLGSFYVVGHSMGGDIGTFMTSGDKKLLQMP